MQQQAGNRLLTIVIGRKVLNVAGEHEASRITKTEVYAHLEAILASDGFRGSTKYRALLGYLVDRGLADDTPHEIDIAVDVFGRDESYDPAESSSVRVCVHHLRKKLEEFYAEYPPAPNLRFTIPKGSYRVSFGTPFISPASEVGARSALAGGRRASRWLAAVCVVSACSLVANVFLLQRLARSPVPLAAGQPAPMPTFAWQDIVEGDEPILIALGDFFFFRDADTYPGRTHFIRDIHINSRDDLREAGVEAYGASVQPSDMTYLPKAAAFALQAILPAAQRAGKPVSLKLMSEVTGEDLRENDVIYIGFIRSMGALQDYFFRSSNFSSESPFLRLHHKGTGKTFASSGDVYGQTQDYGLFSKMAGPGKGELVVFTGIHDIGILHAVRALTDPERGEALEQEVQASLHGRSTAVEILFSVSGYNRSDLEATVAIASPVVAR